MDEARASAMETWFKHAEESSWTVDKADVNSKGTCFFECELACWRENKSYDSINMSQYCTDPDAAARRLDFLVEVKPTKEAIAAKYYVSLGKAWRYKGPDYKFHPEYLEFHVRTVNDEGESKIEVCSWDRLVDLVTEMRKQRRESYYAKVDQLMDDNFVTSPWDRAMAEVNALPMAAFDAMREPGETLDAARTRIIREKAGVSYEQTFDVSDFWKRYMHNRDTITDWAQIRLSLATLCEKVKTSLVPLTDWKDHALHFMQNVS